MSNKLADRPWLSAITAPAIMVVALGCCITAFKYFSEYQQDDGKRASREASSIFCKAQDRCVASTAYKCPTVAQSNFPLHTLPKHGIIPAIEKLWRLSKRIDPRFKAEGAKLTAGVLNDLKSHLWEIDLRNIFDSIRRGDTFSKDFNVAKWVDDYWHEGNRYSREFKITLRHRGRSDDKGPWYFDFIVSPSMQSSRCSDVEGTIYIGRHKPVVADLAHDIRPIVENPEGKDSVCRARVKIKSGDLDFNRQVSLRVLTRAKQRSNFTFYSDVFPVYPSAIRNLLVNLRFKRCPRYTFPRFFDSTKGVIVPTPLRPDQKSAFKNPITKIDRWKNYDNYQGQESKHKQCIIVASLPFVTTGNMPLLAYYP